jgi:uncharacterized protein YoxC
MFENALGREPKESYFMLNWGNAIVEILKLWHQRMRLKLSPAGVRELERERDQLQRTVACLTEELSTATRKVGELTIRVGELEEIKQDYIAKYRIFNPLTSDIDSKERSVSEMSEEYRHLRDVTATRMSEDLEQWLAKHELMPAARESKKALRATLRAFLCDYILMASWNELRQTNGQAGITQQTNVIVESVTHKSFLKLRAICEELGSTKRSVVDGKWWLAVVITCATPWVECLVRLRNDSRHISLFSPPEETLFDDEAHEVATGYDGSGPIKATFLPGLEVRASTGGSADARARPRVRAKVWRDGLEQGVGGGSNPASALAYTVSDNSTSPTGASKALGEEGLPPDVAAIQKDGTGARADSAYDSKDGDSDENISRFSISG